jgi:hypothetical protein
MEKKFMTVLHEEEKMNDLSLDILKGGNGDCDGGCVGKNQTCTGVFNA